MTMPPPAEIGAPLSDVDTPALIIDLVAFERYLARLAERAGAFPGLRVRPHAKTHKSPAIAHRQIAHGAVGMCCQKVGEAEVMVEGGIRDVLVTNEVVGARKLARLAALARQARIGVCVDDPGNVDALSAAVAEVGAEIDVYVEIDVGQGRCGVAPGADTADLAAQVADRPALRLAGLQAYHGAAQHIRDHAERAAAVADAVAAVRTCHQALAERGLEAARVTGAGTGSWPIEAGSGVYHEIQPGSYIFMDADYARVRDAPGAPLAESREHSLYVHARVMSAGTPGRAVVDAGHKAAAVDSGLPVPFDLDGAEFVGASDEHGALAVPHNAGPAVGTLLRLVPGHCDPTVNLHDWYVGIRGGLPDGRVECLWPVAARGALR